MGDRVDLGSIVVDLDFHPGEPQASATSPQRARRKTGSPERHERVRPDGDHLASNDPNQAHHPPLPVPKDSSDDAPVQLRFRFRRETPDGELSFLGRKPACASSGGGVGEDEIAVESDRDGDGAACEGRRGLVDAPRL